MGLRARGVVMRVMRWVIRAEERVWMRAVKGARGWRGRISRSVSGAGD